MFLNTAVHRQFSKDVFKNRKLNMHSSDDHRFIQARTSYHYTMYHIHVHTRTMATYIRATYIRATHMYINVHQGNSNMYVHQGYMYIHLYKSTGLIILR